MRYFEDFPAGAVMNFQGPTLSEDSILEFAGRYDPQPFHVDKVAAENSMFGGLIASGWQTMSLTMRMMCDGYLLDSASLGSPGVDEIRWRLPVRPGDALSLRIEVVDAKRSRSKPDRGVIYYDAAVSNQHGEIVMTFKGMGMFSTRHSAAAR